MDTLETTKVGKIVSDDYRTARIFTEYGIDFCCKGGISLQEACRLKNLAPDQVITALQQVAGTPEETDPAHSLSLTELVTYIIDKHHAYIRSVGPTLDGYLVKIAQVHGERHPELLRIATLFRAGFLALVSHMQKEEHILFPLIQQLNQDASQQQLLAQMLGPVAQMEAEHREEGDRFAEMRSLANDYTPPADGCQTYRVAFRMLEEFETDLHRHIHLENNILFPGALNRNQN